MRTNKMEKPTNARRGLFATAILGLGAPLLLLVIICSPTNVDARAVKENTDMTEQNTDEKVKLENPSDAPLIFTEVVLKPFRREGEKSDKQLVSFSLTVKNQTNRRITRFAFTQKRKSKSELYTEQHITVEPNATQTFLVQIMPQEPKNLTIAMSGAQFEDGTQWGTLHGLPGGKDGMLGAPQSNILNSSQDTLMGKIQKDTLFETTQKDTLFGTTQKETLFETSRSTLFKAQQ